jgi:hypothetical protein
MRQCGSRSTLANSTLPPARAGRLEDTEVIEIDVAVVVDVSTNLAGTAYGRPGRSLPGRD